MAKIDDYLDKLKRNRPLSFPEIGAFLAKFMELLGLEGSEEKPATGEELEGLHVRSVIMNTAHIPLRLGNQMPALYLEPETAFPPPDDLRVLEMVREFLVSRQLDANLCLIIYPGGRKPWYDLCRSSLLALVNLQPTDLQQIKEAPRPRQELFRQIKNQRGFSRLIPYKYTGEVTQDSMFFGRKKELSDIMFFPENFSIYGHRRSGKTSLMRRAQKELEKLRHATFYFDCRAINTYKGLFDKITLNLVPTRYLRTDLSNFSYALRLIGKKFKGRVAVFFDEVDDFIDMDGKNNFKVLKQLHEASNEKWCRFFLAGYRSLFNQCADENSIIRTITRPLRVSVLDEEGAKELVSKPLRALEMEFSSPGLIDHILANTGRHPAFIQFFCGLLAERLGKEGKKKIEKQDLLNIEGDQQIINFISELIFFNTILPERIIIYALLEIFSASQSNRCFFSDLHRYLLELHWNIGSADLDRHIHHLYQINILSRDNDEISFSLEAIPNTLKKFQFRYRLERDLEEIKRCKNLE